MLADFTPQYLQGTNKEDLHFFGNKSKWVFKNQNFMMSTKPSEETHVITKLNLDTKNFYNVLVKAQKCAFI